MLAIISYSGRLHCIYPRLNCLIDDWYSRNSSDPEMHTKSGLSENQSELSIILNQFAMSMYVLEEIV